MNKRNTKNILIEEKILTPAYKKIDENTTVEYIEKHFQYPFVVKPSTEGSSIGVYIVEDRQSYLKAINENLKISNDIIIEQYIDGNEYTVALVGNIALPVIKLVPPGKFYDYEAKYNSNDTKYICPSELSDNVEEELKKISLKCFKVLNCKGWGRVDIIVDSKNKPWIIELNTVQKKKKNSLVPMAAKQVNISFDELVLKILDTSFK